MTVRSLKYRMFDSKMKRYMQGGIEFGEEKSRNFRSGSRVVETQPHTWL